MRPLNGLYEYGAIQLNNTLAIIAKKNIFALERSNSNTAVIKIVDEVKFNPDK
tara:strand:+ start:1547 stop:1705 length:159 start_codon:yes stop_codon:yes gene_type:complete